MSKKTKEVAESSNKKTIDMMNLNELREIKGAMKVYGMIMFYSTPLKEKKTKIEFYPDFKEWLERWIKKI